LSQQQRTTTTKQQRRAAAEAAAAKAAEQKRRNQAIGGALAGLAVVVVLAVVFFVARSGGGETTPPAAAPSPNPSSTAVAFPPLPAGADPALGTKPTVKAGTGDLTKLTVTPIIEGTGPAAQKGQQIMVNYVGALYKTGEEFDSSWSRSEPYTFTLGGNEVIPGWDQGLVGVKEGSRVQLDIPADLAYGENPQGGQPAGPLRFVVDVLAVR
jgi:peptidylprolyl isomerase